VLAFLGQLRSGSFQWMIGGDCGISQPSASRIINACCDHTLTFAKDVVNFPTTILNINKIKQDFHDIAKIPNTIGIVDGTHMPIIAPKDNEPIFVNRKQYHSISCQVVANCSYQITDIVAKWPGSIHDSYIWRNSSIRRRLYDNEFGSGLILDK
jgi:nuclease HARBI1